MIRYPLYEGGWAPWPVSTGAENIAPPPGFDPQTVQHVPNQTSTMGLSNYKAADMLVNGSKPRSVHCLRRTHAASYDETAVQVIKNKCVTVLCSEGEVPILSRPAHSASLFRPVTFPT